ncbi:MAG: YihY/virulence factor BrkB family protein [Actinomycetota bacterium]
MSSPVQNLVAQARLRVERARARYGLVDVAVRTFRRYSEDDGGSYAAALTYYLFLSIFPLLAFALAALGYATLGNAELQKDIFNAGLNAAPLLESALTKEGLEVVAERRQELATTGLVLALYSGSGVIVALEHALNKLNHVVEEPNFVGKRLRSLLWLAILGLSAIISVALSAVGNLTSQIFRSLEPAEDLVAILFYGAGVIVSVGVFATAYKVLPGKDLGWREVLPGAVLAALLFEILKAVGATYLKAGSQARAATFGAFAAAAGLLVASYLICQITLLCAEVNAVLAERRVTRQSLVSGTQGGSA